MLFRMCEEYAEIGLFVSMYLVCSRYRISIGLPVWPTYELLHVLHFNLYMPLELILFCGILSWSSSYMVLLFQKDIFKLILLNKLVTLCVSGL